MNIKELLDIANKGYPDEFLSQYYNGQGKAKKGSGDTLAEFIVNELIETFDLETDDQEQMSTAIEKLNMAVTDLEQVVVVLEHGFGEVWAKNITR